MKKYTVLSLKKIDQFGNDEKEIRFKLLKEINTKKFYWVVEQWDIIVMAEVTDEWKKGKEKELVTFIEEIIEKDKNNEKEIS